MDEFLLVSVRIFFGKGGIQVLVRLGEGWIVAIEQIPGIHIHRHAQPGHFGHIQFGPFIGIGKKHYALGMIHQITNAFRGKICQDRDNYGFVGINSHIGHTPAGTVAGAKGNLISLAETGFLKEKMETSDGLGHLGICKRLAVNIVQGGFVPILKRGGLKPLKIMRIILHIDLLCIVQK